MSTLVTSVSVAHGMSTDSASTISSCKSPVDVVTVSLAATDCWPPTPSYTHSSENTHYQRHLIYTPNTLDIIILSEPQCFSTHTLLTKQHNLSLVIPTIVTKLRFTHTKTELGYIGRRINIHHVSKKNCASVIF